MKTETYNWCWKRTDTRKHREMKYRGKPLYWAVRYTGRQMNQGIGRGTAFKYQQFEALVSTTLHVPGESGGAKSMPGTIIFSKVFKCRPNEYETFWVATAKKVCLDFCKNWQEPRRSLWCLTHSHGEGVGSYLFVAVGDACLPADEVIAQRLGVNYEDNGQEQVTTGPVINFPRGWKRLDLPEID